MFRLLVPFALVSFAACKPGLVHGGIATAVAAPVSIIAPSAVSQQSRHDIISPGVITVNSIQAIPVAVAAPVVATVPAVSVGSAATSSLDVRGPVGHVGIGGVGIGLGSYGGYRGYGGGVAGGLVGGLVGGLGGGLVGGLGGGLVGRQGGVGLGIGSNGYGGY